MLVDQTSSFAQNLVKSGKYINVHDILRNMFMLPMVTNVTNSKHKVKVLVLCKWDCTHIL